ncbi:MAG: hypothetical protein OXE93_04320 [bacterium]|nr:hypothetical protein [bacterium]MCY4258492.1 hypothetical protein [bacterium]
MSQKSRPCLLDSRALRKATMWCPSCDVTWWGTTSDTCWSCSEHTATNLAPNTDVRMLTASTSAES